MNDEAALRCHLCGGALILVAGFERLIRVTSDCRPWRTGGRLGTCEACGTVQKPLDVAWHADCAEIYGSYAIYDQAEGREQCVFDQQSGAATTRSARLMGQLTAACDLPTRGRLLDIGCGNGAFLAAFGAARPQWRLTGVEVGETNRAVVEALPGVEVFHTGPIESLAGLFDLVAMIHCLEHVPGPVAFLRRVARLLAPRGRLLIEVPDLATNPFDLLIADHATHFTAVTLPPVLAAAGFAAALPAEPWVPKELSALGELAPFAASERPAGGDPVLAASAVAWLQGVRDRAATGATGIFGTSIAGTWLAAEMGERAGFFLDEDPNRIGRRHMGRPILAPAAVPAGAPVMVPFPAPIAADIRRRLPQLDAILPPDWDATDG